MGPSKILVIKLRSLGDTVIMTAPLQELARAFPQATIDVLVTREWAPLLHGFPGIRRVWAHQRHKENTARAYSLARLGYQLRKEKFDCVVNFHASPSSAALALATGAQMKAVHFHGHKQKNHYSTVTIPGKGILKPIIERDMDVVRALGVHVPAGRLPQVHLQVSELRDAGHLLQRLGMNAPILALSLGGSRPTKTWPIQRYASLAIDWCRKEKGSSIALAGPAEDELVEDFLKSVDDLLQASLGNSAERAEIRHRITATNQLTLRSLAGVLASVSAVAGNDSGPRHLAVAVNTPTVTLFGPEHPFEWHPYPPELNPYLFIDQLSCRRDADPGMPAWCGLNQCTVEEHKCMMLIGIDSVLKACREVRKKNADIQ